jgi:hypothetical protein
MNITDAQIVKMAVEARSHADVYELNAAIAESVGGDFRRPVGDKWGNFGMMSHSGDFDHKLIECVTNAQDAIIEREVQLRFGAAKVPFLSPHEAAAALLDRSSKDAEGRIMVEIGDPGGNALEDYRISFVVRDDGCGMRPEQLPLTILQLGSSQKRFSTYQQGAFGLGVKSAFRNARAAVVVTRPAPEIDEGADVLSVATVQWEQDGQALSAYYLTTCDWNEGKNADAIPWSTPVTDEIVFAAGTQLTLIEYQSRYFSRKFAGDDRTFDLVARTRLHDPVIPFRHISYLMKKPEPRTVRGLAQFLPDAVARRDDLRSGSETMPFLCDGQTYQLPVTWWVFPGPKETGARKQSIAAGHVVSFTSSGQIHNHWDQSKFRSVTGLGKLDNRIYVVVETDEIPIATRTNLFTPDRSALLPSDNSIRLEREVGSFLKDYDDLRELNSQFLREEIERSVGGQKTRDVARRISASFQAKGFGTSGGTGEGTGRNKPPGRPKHMKLKSEPTELIGQKTITVRPGEVRSLRYFLDARNTFTGVGGPILIVECDHPAIGAREMPVGVLHDGRIRVGFAIPDDAQLGQFGITATVPQWPSSSGGVARPLSWTTSLTVTDERRALPAQPNVKAGAQSAGTEVALIWTDGEDRTWTPLDPGVIEEMPAVELARRPEYKDLAKLGETPIPTIVLHEKYSPLARYIASLTRARKTATVDRTRDRYAEGIGVGFLVMHTDPNLKDLEDDVKRAVARTYARTALSLLPLFNRMAEQIDEANAVDEGDE